MMRYRLFIMQSFFGIPAHPLLVHIPAVLLPLAAIGVVIMVIRPSWHRRYRWAVLAIGFAGTLGAVLATQAGEEFQDQIIAKKGFGAAGVWEDHVEAGQTAQVFALIFFGLLAAFILVPWFMERRDRESANDDPTTAGTAHKSSLPKWATTALAVLVLAGSAGTVVTVILAGHSGAKAVWCETNSPPNCPSGG